ncbi:MAG: hypothetical protein PHE06_15010 [Lachnospiraceae bacterium]|nr:hypothetical protein [Lachnospiraceae bacterium]
MTVSEAGREKICQEHKRDVPYAANLELLRVEVKTRFTAMRKGGAKCQVQENNARMELIIWPDHWNMLQKQFPQWFQIGNQLSQLSFWGNRQCYQGREQLIFQLLPKGR